MPPAKSINVVSCVCNRMETLLVPYLVALVAGPLVVVTQLVTVDGVKIVSRLTDPATSHARLRVGRMLTALILTKASAS